LEPVIQLSASMRAGIYHLSQGPRIFSPPPAPAGRFLAPPARPELQGITGNFHGIWRQENSKLSDINVLASMTAREQGICGTAAGH
jgi:hypothetical protein